MRCPLPVKSGLGALPVAVLTLMPLTACDRTPEAAPTADAPADSPATAPKSEPSKPSPESASHAELTPAPAPKSPKVETVPSSPPITSVNMSKATPKVESARVDATAGPILSLGAANPPVRLTSLRLQPMQELSGRQFGTVQLYATLEVRRRTTSVVMVDAVCRHDDEIVTDTAELSHPGDIELSAVRPKATTTQDTALFMSGLDHAPNPCTLSLFLAPPNKSRPPIPLGRACWEGRTITAGDCTPAIQAPMTVAASKPIVVRFGDTKSMSTPYDAVGLGITQRWTFNEVPADDSELKLKVSCQIDGKWMVDVSSMHFPKGEIRIRPGQTKGLDHEMFDDETFHFTSWPSLCELTTSMWAPSAGSRDTLDETLVDRSCLRDLAVTKGPCDPGHALLPPGSAALTTANATIDDVLIRAQRPIPGDPQVYIRVEVTLSATERPAQDQEVFVRMSCHAAGKRETLTDTLTSSWVDAYDLQPWESVRLGHTFTPDGDLPDRCEAEFIGGRKLDTGSTLATACLEGGTVSAGACGSPSP